MAYRRNKYGAKKTVVDGITFDSKAEAKRYSELKLLERAKQIWGLARQKSFPLVVKGVPITTYRADFSYFDARKPTGRRIIIEDVKGVRTREFIIKKKLMKALYGIEIVEISKSSPRPPATARAA